MKYEYNKIDQAGIDYLKSVTAQDRVYRGEDIKEEYSHDEAPEYGRYMPDVVVEALTTEEVSKIMKFAYDNCIPVTPRGAGTGLSGAAVALYGGIVLSLARMNKILNIDLENLSADVEPGVLLMDLAAEAEKHDLMYPPQPGEMSATLGGNVMTNAGGMRAVKYGVTRDYVRALEAVLPDGEIIQLSSNVAKNSSGYAIKDLVIGSEGTLCIATRITLKLLPLPKRSVSLLAAYTTLDQCIDTVPKFSAAKLIPTTLEYMQRDVIDAAEEFLGKNFPEKRSNAFLIITFDGNTKDEINACCDQAAEICLSSGANDVYICDTEERKEPVWSVRKATLEAIKATSDGLDECDVVVPRNKVAEFEKYSRLVCEETGIRMTTIGHAGDGNIHVSLCRDQLPEKEWHDKVQKVLGRLYRKAKELGGQVSGEHGIGHAKIDVLREFVGKRTFDLFKALKMAFDEKNILNPGKIVN
ncbi:MAG: FAD-binding oxidoreductase [Deltaproteobacteria bacterium]|nr:FAD-binding oxidoreductase [Deltaproteobacteria bacterium]